MTDMLAHEWSTPRCWVRDSTIDEAHALLQLSASCSALGAVDPMFTGGTEAGLLDLIDSSLRGESGFRMQTIGLRGEPERIGYLHLSQQQPQRETAWISALVLGARYQEQGYGREVTTELLAQLGALGWCAEVWLEVYAGNQRALQHWVARGFRRIVEVRTPVGVFAGYGPSLVLAYKY